MRRYYIMMLGVMLAFAAAERASAQKYPERRIIRQGTKLYAKGDFAGAEEAYRHALELTPGFREAEFNLGNALLRRERAEEAAAAYMNVAADSLAETGLMADAGFNLGNVALAGQKIDEAIEFYKQSLRLNPDDEQAKYNLAYAWKMKQEQEQNEDENKDKNQDGGSDDGQQNDDSQNNEGNDEQDKDGDGQNDDGSGGQNDEQNDGQNDNQNGDGDRGGDQSQNGDNPPSPSQQSGGGEALIDSQTAAQMLDAMQAEEDDTREKINAREVQAVAPSGKNW